LLAFRNWNRPRPTCLMLLEHSIRLAVARADITAGNTRAIRMPMIAMTTSSSISVNPRGRLLDRWRAVMARPFSDRERGQRKG